MNLTAKQIELLRVIAGGEGGEPCDLDQILENVRYQTTKASLHFSIRALIKHGLIEKLTTEHRRGRQRRPIAVTALGQGYAGGKPGVSNSANMTSLEVDDMEIIELSE